MTQRRSVLELEIRSLELLLHRKKLELRLRAPLPKIGSNRARRAVQMAQAANPLRRIKPEKLDQADFMDLC